MVGHLEGVAMTQLMSICDKISGELILDALKNVIDILDVAFGDKDCQGDTLARHIVFKRYR
jgi:hypothetical protein